MGQKKCRYDYVVIAVDALKSYMGTCATEANTMQLIEDAHSAVLELKEIEKGIVSRKTGTKTAKTITAAIDEFTVRARKLEPVTEAVGKFLNENKTAFDEIEKIAEFISVVKATNTKLNQIKSGIDSRMDIAV